MNCTKIANDWQEALIDKPDFLKQAIQVFMQKALEEEFRKFIGADEHQRTEQRTGYRNGSYPRQLKTRVGTLDLNVCRDREGEFKTEIFDRYQRSEKALVLGIIEMYLWGVSTRNIEKIMEPLCGFSVSKSQVSELAGKLDIDLDVWRTRPLTTEYMYVMFDARYEKIRENGRVISKAFVVAVGITVSGEREILGTYIINSESYEGWDSCLKGLRDRGLKGVKYVVSDDNKGLRGAIDKHFQGVIWQRCQVHFMRNFMGKLAQSEKGEGIRLLQEVFAATTNEDAEISLAKVGVFLMKKKKDEVWNWLEENVEETLVVLNLPIEHRKKMKSTNMLERFNQELKRRSRVIRIFPNEQSCLRLLTALCQETSEGWGSRKYLGAVS
jgi:transposase-like protein